MIPDIDFNLYKEPEWMRWENMPEYDAPVPFECIRDMQWEGWKIHKVCVICGKRIGDDSTFCTHHGKFFRKPEIKIPGR